jgi:hypothetical protein
LAAATSAAIIYSVGATFLATGDGGDGAFLHGYVAQTGYFDIN